MHNIRIEVYGKVNKVGFLYFIKSKATNLNLCGFVKYSGDHNIIIEASGSENAIDQLIGHCRLGTPWAHVEGIKVTANNIQHKEPFNIEFGEINSDEISHNNNHY